MNGCQPPNCPCYCPAADTPVAPILVPQGGPGEVIDIPIYGTQGFSVSIVTNPTYQPSGTPAIALVQMHSGNVVRVTTGSPAIDDTITGYDALIRVCNACGTLDIPIRVDVVADLNPVVTNCLLAQGLWTPEARVPTVGDTLLAFTPAGCRALLPPLGTCADIQAFPPVVATLGTQLATADCGLATVSDVIALIDFCAPLQAFPVALPGPLDTVYGQQGGVCSQFTIFDIAANVDICTLLQNLPNAVVQPTAVFYGQQGGACFEFAVADLLALVPPPAIPCPILASCDGSCAAPAYSFASAPSFGMFYGVDVIGDGTGPQVVIGANTCGAALSVGELSITAFVPTGSATIDAGVFILFQSGGTINLETPGMDLLIDSAGAINLNGDPGAAGEVLTSNGPGTPPTWQSAGAVSFPLLAPNGSCAAPSYSFTSDASSGMFYDAGLGAVTIGDANCTDFITIGASIRAESTGPGASIALNVGGSGFGVADALVLTFNPQPHPQLPNIASKLTGRVGVWTLVEGGTGDAVFGTGNAYLLGGYSPLVATSSGGSAVVQGGYADGGGKSAGDALIVGGFGSAGALHGSVRINTGGTNRLTFSRLGEWMIPTAGLAGQVITSNGPGLAPTWQTAAGPSFPMLAPNGTCAAPSYSFTNSPDSGMFYTGTSVRIGDDNCTDFIDVGASVTIFSSASNISLTAVAGQIHQSADTVSANAASAFTVQSFGTMVLQAATFINMGSDTTLITGASGGVSIQNNAVGGQVQMISLDGDIFIQTTQPPAQIRMIGGTSPGGASGGLINVTSGSDAPTTTGQVGIQGGSAGTRTGGSISTGGWIGGGGPPATIRGGSDSAGSGQGVQVKGGTGGPGVGGFVFIDSGDGAVAGNILIRSGLPSGVVHVTIDGTTNVMTIGALTALLVSLDNGMRFSGQTNAAGAAAGTLANAPSAGNPAFWLPVTVNGATRFIPCWA